MGIGNISYFGKIAYVGTDCVLPNGNNFDFSKGAFTITAANGDQIYGTYSGTLKPTGISPLSKMPIYTISGGTFTITHGTGKFVHAQGQGQLNGTEELSATPFDPDTPSHGQFQLTGSIRY